MSVIFLNHQQLDCIFNSLLWLTSTPCITGPFQEKFPVHRANNVEKFPWHDGFRWRLLSTWPPRLKKPTSCHNANFVATGGTAVCQNDNHRCYQWRQSWHRDNFRFSMKQQTRVPVFSNRACKFSTYGQSTQLGDDRSHHSTQLTNTSIQFNSQ